MGQREKLLERWRHNTPKDVPVDEVEAVVEYYFSDSRVEGRRGSHRIVIRDRRLRNRGEFGPLGQLIIPVKGGQRVKGVYLAMLATAIEIILEEDLAGGEK
jgi:hypothetical protein